MQAFNHFSNLRAKLLLLIAFLGITAITFAAPGDTIRISVDSNNLEGDSFSDFPSVSVNGQFVAFYSNSSNLVPNDTNNASDIFVRDVQNGMTSRVSVDSFGIEGNNHSFRPEISDDGMFVAYGSRANNLVPNDTNGNSDIFIHHRPTGLTTRVSVATGGGQANNNSHFASTNVNGQFIAFDSDATNLVVGDTNIATDIFVHNQGTGVTTRVSVGPMGAQANAGSYRPKISADGTTVAFYSSATNLVPGDTNNKDDIFVHHIPTGITSRVSVSSMGLQANDNSKFVSLNANGQFVAFDSFATNLVPGDTNGMSDIFVHDRATGITNRISVDSAGAEANENSYFPSIDDSAQFIAYYSFASNLIANDTNGAEDIFVFDAANGNVQRVSIDSALIEGNKGSDFPSLSPNAGFVAFRSAATNLICDDTNDFRDIYMHDLTGIGINTPPNIVSITPSVSNPINIQFQPISLTTTFNDPDCNDTLTVTYDWGDGLTDSSSTATSPISFSHVYANGGTYGVKVTISDAAGNVVEEIYQSFVIIPNVYLPIIVK